MIPVAHSKPSLTPADRDAVAAILATGMIGQGAQTIELEHQLSAWLGGTGGVAVGSGTAALTLALQAVGCGPGGEVIFPTYVCRAVLQAVCAVGSTPVPCDVGEDWLVEPAQVGPLVTPRTQAIIVPHLYGLFCDVAAFRGFNVAVVEDCAQALGPPGSHAMGGDVAVLSFHPTKCLTTGEGGMAIARAPELLTRMQKLRDDDTSGGARRLFSPLSDLAAALGLSQLRRYDSFLARRREIASCYAQALGRRGATLAPWWSRRPTMYFRFPLRIPDGLEGVAAGFSARGVTVRRGVDELLHRLAGLSDAAFPRAVRHYHETVSLPIYPALTDEELGRCAEAVRAILQCGV